MEHFKVLFINSEQSTVNVTDFGLPQETVLSCILFLLYQ